MTVDLFARESCCLLQICNCFLVLSLVIIIIIIIKAYGSGFNIVILSSQFERVQVISGKKFSNSIVRCIECTLDTGKVHCHISLSLSAFIVTIK